MVLVHICGFWHMLSLLLLCQGSFLQHTADKCLGCAHPQPVLGEPGGLRGSVGTVLSLAAVRTGCCEGAGGVMQARTGRACGGPSLLLAPLFLEILAGMRGH